MTAALNEAIRSIIPDFCGFSGGIPADHTGPIFAEEESLLRNAVPRRRSEFRAGRMHARLALAQLGIEPAAIGRDDRGSPIWPQGISGSITHVPTYCAAVVVRTRCVDSIGIDVEYHDPLERDLCSLICTEHDCATPDLDIDFPKLCFCIKESVYKAYYPLQKTVIDFLDATVRINAARRSFEAAITSTQYRFRGNFRRVGDIIFSFAIPDLRT